MKAIFERELKSYFTSITGWLFSAFLLIFAGIYTMAYNLSGSYANFEYVLSSISFIYLIAVPILSMRVLADEKRQKTDQLLYSLPIRLSDIVMGKYLAMLVVLLVPLAVMALYPLILSQFGSVYLPTAYGTLLAFFLLGAALLSIGLFISSVTENQVMSAVICLVVMLILYFMSGLASFVSTTSFASLIALCILALVLCVVLYLLTKNYVVSLGVLAALVAGLLIFYNVSPSTFSGLFPNIMNALSLFDRFETFVNGVFDLSAIVYYLSITGVFLFFSTQALEKRRWSE